MVVPVGVVQVVLGGVVCCLIHQLPVWPVRVSVALLWVTVVAVRAGAAGVVKDVLSMVVVHPGFE